MTVKSLIYLASHVPNEHMLAPVAREALQVMTGIYWDLGDPGVPA